MENQSGNNFERTGYKVFYLPFDLSHVIVNGTVPEYSLYFILHIPSTNLRFYHYKTVSKRQKWNNGSTTLLFHNTLTDFSILWQTL